MTNFFKNIIIIFFTICLLVSCSKVLEPVNIGLLDKEKLMNIEEQNEFNVQVKTLTLSEANTAKADPYKRNVMIHGTGELANLVAEANFIEQPLLTLTEAVEYKLGIGDEITFQNFKENTDLDTLNFMTNSLVSSNIIKSSGRVSSDGSLLLIGLGKLDANGRTLGELRDEVRNILIRTGLTPNFQLDITDFVSKNAYIFSQDSDVEGIITITDRPLTLKELTARSNYTERPNFVNLISLIRDKNIYKLTSEYLFDENRPEIFIQDKDQINLDFYPYKPGQVYVMNAGVSATIFPIDPVKRETMADVMFLEGGPFASYFSKRSEVYLLRGQNPVTAYHLDAQNASRVLVAAAMELRPSDILFVAERPIISFARLLSEINPLRTLLADIKDNNIP